VATEEAQPRDLYRRLEVSSAGAIGAGVIGAMCARFLRDAGISVTVYDPGVGRAQATWASAGLLLDESDDHPEAWLALARRGMELWAGLGERFPELEYRRVGVLLLGQDPDAIAWREANGYRTEVAEWGRQPALLMPEACVIRPTRVATALLQDVARVATAVESVDAVLRDHDIAVIAAGAWSQPLLDQVGVRLEVRPRRGQMMLFDSGRLPLVLRTAERQIALPRADGRVAVGTTWEDAGFDARTDAATLDRLEAWARAQVPGLGERETAWAGLRPWSDRDVPTIGWVGDRVLVAVGHHRDGLVLGPATGELVRDLVLGQPHITDRHQPDPFSPEQWEGTRAQG
jgi:glycine oxidase